jgi:hypothetical protein
MTRDLVITGLKTFIKAEFNITKKMIEMKEGGQMDRGTIEMRIKQEMCFAEDACFIVSGFLERDITYNVRRLGMADSDQEYLDICSKHKTD